MIAFVSSDLGAKVDAFSLALAAPTPASVFVEGLNRLAQRLSPSGRVSSTCLAPVQFSSSTAYRQVSDSISRVQLGMYISLHLPDRNGHICSM